MHSGRTAHCTCSGMHSTCRGVSIGFLSLYPKEKEYLYLPLIYLYHVSSHEEDGHLLAVVSPQIP